MDGNTVQTQYSYKNLLDEMSGYLMKVKQESRLLIESNIWDSISLERLDAWLNNFVTDEEKLLSAILLDNLIFRSADQTKALLFNAFESVLPSLMTDNPWKVLDKPAPINVLSKRNDKNSKTRIVPVIRDIDPPTKSGPSVARLYRRYLNISDDFMIWPWQIESNYENGVDEFIFIDDVLGSGIQFSDFIKKYGLEKYKKASFMYIPLLAYKDGIDKIKKDFPFLKVAAVENIDKSNNFFNRRDLCNIHDLKDLYLEVESKKLNKRLLGRMSMGYEKLSLTFSYGHATPNSTLPLYWYEDDNYFPLVKR